ncbi:hypothetical protein H5410_062113 [Solanum commersonii]|uniref:At1g61320/AtMIF1 LRR domain-containing protein n=1 Tax=Solanum commersonii TaxID=4109 RepID=A0A9J5W9J0_SOLCO|nr:hypothetical protein H5410_062113 [Solanum commersonii]
MWHYGKTMNEDGAITTGTVANNGSISGCMSHVSNSTKERMKHINLINNVLDFHKGGHLEEFTLSFPFHKHFKRLIDKCLNFVVSKKKVEIFQLDLSLSKNEHRLNLSPFVSLKVLTFNNVDVDDRVVNFFIFNCPLLEKLSIHESRLLTCVKIVGPSCFNLKDLELCHCIGLDLIKIHNINLVSFKYIGWKSNFLLENVTSVLTIDFKMSRALICELNHCFLDHTLPKFNNLKVLVLKVVGVTESLLGITPLIEASPYLQKLHIELEWCEMTISKNRIIRKKCPHQHLKENMMLKKQEVGLDDNYKEKFSNESS